MIATPAALSQLNALTACTWDWWLGKIKAGKGRTEAVMRDLQHDDTPFYLPVCKHRYDSGYIAIKPLFPGYVFLNGDSARFAALESDNIYQVELVAAGMQKQLTGELQTVAKALQFNPFLTAGPAYRKGALVRIVWNDRYPEINFLAGTLGRVCFENNAGIYVNVEFMNAGIPLAIPPACLERVKEPKQKKRKLLVVCRGCASDTTNISGICDRCSSN